MHRDALIDVGGLGSVFRELTQIEVLEGSRDGAASALSPAAKPPLAKGWS
jgi:hypothetical protein